jgi:hypothetical protein
MADSPITYEGDDTRDHDERFRRLYAMPGDRLRVDPKARVEGTDGATVAETTGSEPLTVSKTVMTGEQGMVRPEYEFEGVKGRFNARFFQHELGEQGMYAVLAMRDSEMWAVPVDIQYAKEGDARGDVVTLQGPAREIVGFAGKMTDEIHPDGVEGMRKELGEGAFTGEIYVRNATSFEDKAGPVNIVAMPMSYGAPSERESAVAGAAIDAAVFEKRIDEVARDSAAVLKLGIASHVDGGEPSEVSELADALDARKREPSPRSSGRVLDAAEAMLGMLDDRSLSNSGAFEALSTSVDAAARPGDDVLRSRYADLGLQPAVARQMEALASQHDAAVGDSTSTRPTAAVAGAAMAAMSRGR